MYVFITMNSN